MDKWAHQIPDIEHACHSHYNYRIPPPYRRKRDVGEQQQQYDLDELERLFPHVVDLEEEESEEQVESPVVERQVLRPEDEGYTRQTTTETDKPPCVPIPMFITGLCGHVSNDPVVSIIVLVFLLLAIIVEVVVLVFCGVWMRRSCVSCGKAVQQRISSSNLSQC